ncbi:MAG: CotH kinase family protein, partial [Verrucomicrobiales bacterium]|nr:CotH kinase family protein [Verrucomicrobiales bacterium]
LPPVIEEVRFAPPAPQVPTTVTARLRPDVPVQRVELRYQSVADAPGASETVVAMSPGKAQGTFTAEIPAQPTGRLLRFRVRAVGTQGTQRFEPAQGEPCPTFSAYLQANTNRLAVPSAILLPLGPKESPGSSLRYRTRRGTPPAPRGQSAFIYFPTNGAPVQTFDHIRLTPRAGGWKVRLHKDRPLDEMTTINLVYEHQPRWVLSEPLGYELFRKSGIPTPKTGHLRLWLQGRPMGYHLMVEQPNASFLRHNQRDSDGNLYKLLWYGQDLVGQHEKKNNPETGHTDLVALVRSLQSRDSAAQWELIQREFNVEELCTYFAVGMCIQNWDGFFNNYFAYHGPGKTGKWEMIPWDLDKTWGDYDGASPEFDWYEMPLTYGMKGDQEPGGRFNLFRQRNSPWGANAWWRPGGYFSAPLLANPEFRQRFLKRLRVLCDTVFTEKEFLPVIDSLERRLEPEVRHRATLEGEDPGAAAAAFHDRMESFRRQLKHRRAYLLQELGREPGGK